MKIYTIDSKIYKYYVSSKRGQEKYTELAQILVLICS